MNEAFIGINLFFLSLAFIVFVFGIILIASFSLMVAEEVYSKIKVWLAFRRFYKSQEKIIRQIKQNVEKENKEGVDLRYGCYL